MTVYVARIPCRVRVSPSSFPSPLPKLSRLFKGPVSRSSPLPFRDVDDTRDEHAETNPGSPIPRLPSAAKDTLNLHHQTLCAEFVAHARLELLRRQRI